MVIEGERVNAWPLIRKKEGGRMDTVGVNVFPPSLWSSLALTSDYTTNLVKMEWKCVYNDVHLTNFMWKVKLFRFSRNKNLNHLSVEGSHRQCSLTAPSDTSVVLFVIFVLFLLECYWLMIAHTKQCLINKTFNQINLNQILKDIKRSLLRILADVQWPDLYFAQPWSR